MNLVTWHQKTYGVTGADRATQLANPAFDASVWEVWPYLAAGASVHFPDEETRLLPGKLPHWLDERRITLCFLPTPLLEETKRSYDEAVDSGWGKEDFSAVTHVVEKRIGRRLSR